MKNTLLILILFISASGFSQVVLKTSEGFAKYDRDSLQQSHFYQIMSDEIITCFSTSPEFFLAEWTKFSIEVSKYLKEKNFLFGKRMKGQIDVYFDKSGKIELFFIEIRDPSFKEERYEEMCSLIKEFASNYRFTIDASKSFTNTSTINFLY
jgi:hypothetical protein